MEKILAPSSWIDPTGTESICEDLSSGQTNIATTVRYRLFIYRSSSSSKKGKSVQRTLAFLK
jgi:hypothetical protein